MDALQTIVDEAFRQAVNKSESDDLVAEVPTEESLPDEQLETRVHEAGYRQLESKAEEFEKRQAEIREQEVTAGEAAKKIAEAGRAVAGFVKGLYRNGCRIAAKRASLIGAAMSGADVSDDQSTPRQGD